MKNIIKKSFVCAFAALVGLATQAVSINYINANGLPDTADCTAITSSTTTLNTGWYVVEGQLSFYKTVTVSGEANLILADNARFTLNGDWEHAGINVPPGCLLAIYGQSEGTGELNVTGGYYSAGIGGNRGQSCGTVTINGGVVNVTGGNYGAAIGGGNGESGDPSIGAGGAVTVNGGTVTAQGGNYGAGIGGGYYGNGGTVRVNGGAVTAISGNDYSAGIGKGAFGSAVNGTLTVGSGLAVLAGASEATSTTHTPDSVTGAVTLSGQKWFYIGAPSLKQTTSEIFVAYHEATPINVSLADTIIGGSGTYTFTEKANLPSWLSISGMSLVGTPPNTGSWTFSLTATDASDSSLTVDAEYTLYVQVTGDVSVTFMGENGAPRTETCTVVERTMTTLSDIGSSDGWFVVYNDVEFTSSVTVSGDVKLVLLDSKTMTITEDSDTSHAGIVVTGSNSLTVYGQSQNSGTLNATGGSISAGIGGSYGQAGGTITINGGTVNATATSGGAGIGGGYQQAGGSVTINGGIVTAIGQGAGIGGGGGSPAGTGGTVTINGGTVTATGGYSGTGIGGGSSAVNQGTLTVGANVVVKAGTSSNLTDGDILPHGDGGAITLEGQRYFAIVTTGPVPLTQTTSVLAAYVGQAFEQALSATVSGGQSPYTFEKTSGTLPDELTFSEGVISGTPTAPASETVVFTVTDSSEPTQNESFTYTITVTQPPRTITYKDGANTINGLSPTQYTPGTATALAASATKTGYTFVNWYDNDGLAGDPVTEVSASETENKTYWAKWNLVNYTITYHNVTGVLTPATYNIETSTITLPTPEVGEGETFVGWYETSTFTGSAVTQIAQGSTGNMDFYAKITSSSEPEEPEPSGDGFIDDDPEEPAQAWNVVTVECQTAQGVFQRKCKQLSSGYWAELNDSWYYVTGEVTIESVEVAGKASLILGDGATLTVGSDYTPGIQLTQGNTLTIYGQSGGTGVLIANGGDSCAGIGGGMMMDGKLCGKLNIYGGNITATSGDDWAPGIGTTDSEADSTGQIYIYGGTVTATGSNYFGGIGGNKWYDQGLLVVGANMTVTAGANADSAEALTPDANGVVTLSAQKYFHIESAGDLPLAQSQSAFTKNVGDTIALSGTISGGKKPYAFSGTVPTGLTLADGTITCNTVGTYNFSLTVTDADSTVIQATYAITVEKKEKSITYIDGTDGVTVLTGLTPNEYTPGGSTVNLPNASAVIKAGYTFNGWYLTPELDQGGSQVYAIYSWDSYTSDLTLYAKFTQINYTIIYYDHNNDPLNLTPSAYTIADTPVALPTPDSREGFTFDGWCENSDRSDTPTMTIPENSIPSGVYYKAFYAKWTENAPGPGPGPGPEPGEGEIEVQFVDANGDPMQQLCTVVTADTATFTNGGWYVVNADVSRDGTIAVEGSANLVLVDDETLTITVSSSSAGISVTNGCSLTIYGQSNGTGAIDATGGSFGAGIGGNYGDNSDHTVGACGTVVINGGTIVAKGNSAAGIGGGTYGNGGTVTINGGTVTATGGNNSAGIGGGQYGSTGGTVTINGGAIHAEGGGNSAGIGGGARCSGAVVTINGGNVRADSGVNAGAGIGSGRTWGDVVVSNGSLRVAATMTVYASTNLFETAYTAEHIREVDSSRFLEVENEWHSFLVAEGVAPVGTYHSIQYRDEFGYIIDGLSPTQYVEGVGVSLATAVPSKAGYEFAYWYEEGAEDTPVTAVSAEDTEDKVFRVKWTPVVYTITYYFKGEPVELEPSTYTKASTTWLPEETNGYVVKWHVGSLEGEEVYYLGPTVDYTGNISLYAETWLAKPYTITFYDSENGEQFVKPYLYMINYNANSETFDLPRTAHKDWKKFVNWYDNIELEGDPVTSIPSGSYGNKLLYAKWEDTTDAVATVDAGNNLVAVSLNGHTHLDIPDGVVNINGFVLYNFTTLETVTIPEGVTNIGEMAFCRCTSLQAIELPESLRSIEWCAFDTCSSLEYVYIPKGVTIGDWAFFLCENLTSVNIGGTVVSPKSQKKLMRYLSSRSLLRGATPADPDAISVGKNVFSCCRNLASAKIGSKVAEIGGGVFSGCTSLTEIEFEDNENYTQQGNFLLSDSGATLVSVFGDDTAVTVPSGVTNILNGAFAGYSTLTSIVLPSGVTTIGEAAFSNATAFATITIPSSVTAIGANAFSETILKTVYVSSSTYASTARELITASGYDTTGVEFLAPTESITTLPSNEWMEENGVEGATADEIKEALLEPADNGMPKWQNYVLGQDGDEPLSVAPAASNPGTPKVATLGTTFSAPSSETTGFNVTYTIEMSDKTSGVATTNTNAAATVDLDSTLAEKTSATYEMKMTVVMTSATSVITQTVEKTVGVMKVESGAEYTIVAVPWKSLGTGDIKVNELLHTGNRSEDDMLYAYDKDNKDYAAGTWKLNADKIWEPVGVAKDDTMKYADENMTIKRGQGVWLKRVDKNEPIYLLGQVAEEPTAAVEVELEAGTSEEPTWNLVASPATEDLNVAAKISTVGAANDQIIVPTAGAPVNYTVHDNQWGYWKPVKGDDGIVRKEWTTTDIKVPAGTGFWYLNGSSKEGLDL